VIFAKLYKDMSKILNKLVTIIICVSVLCVSGIGCSSQPNPQELEKQVATVQLGNLAITVSVDGNLVMPQAYDLLFGAPGNVEDVLVEEGDFVKAGTMLARLDDTTERLDIRSANGDVQKVLSDLYETVPLLPQFPTVLYEQVSLGPPIVSPPSTTVHTDIYFLGDTIAHPGGVPATTSTTVETTTVDGYTPGSSMVTQTTTVTITTVGAAIPSLIPPPGTQTQTTTVTQQVTTSEYINRQKQDTRLGTSSPYYYPNVTALSAFNWAQDEVNRAHELYQIKGYDAAASELNVASSDLESCIKVFEDTINNPKSGLGNIAPFINEDAASLVVQQYYPFATIYIRELRKLVDSIKQGQADMEKIQDLIAQGKYEETAPLFEPLLDQVDDIGKVVIRDVNKIKTPNYATIYGEDLCLSLYGAAEDSLNKAFIALGEYGLDSPEFSSNLRIAQHEMALCNGILGANDYVLKHGLSLKAEQEYKLNLQNAMVGLENKKDDLLKTVIVAPFDGTVVSVGVKKNDVLSAMDYSSKTAVQLVDTSQIKFQGLVDEIDILKIETGQKAAISVDAVPDKTFTGTVSFISPYGSTDTGNVVKFAVTIKLDPTDVELKGGLTATADVAVYNAEDVLLVPLSAVMTTPEGSFVTVTNEATGQAEKRQVALGRQNYQFVEVLSGLSEGDKVIIEEKAVVGAPVDTTPPHGPPR
jgi:multidrug efflux pump subunit AcrA (membrane-fusion protein)